MEYIPRMALGKPIPWSRPVIENSLRKRIRDMVRGRNIGKMLLEKISNIIRHPLHVSPGGFASDNGSSAPDGRWDLVGCCFSATLLLTVDEARPRGVSLTV